MDLDSLIGLEQTFIGDTIPIVLDVGEDISAYDTFTIMYRKPDGVIGSWDADIVPYYPTKIAYTTLEEDLDVPGIWAVQALITDTDVQIHGLWAQFTVFTPLIEVLPT